jgi:hypothetical protein
MSLSGLVIWYNRFRQSQSQRTSMPRTMLTDCHWKKLSSPHIFDWLRLQQRGIYRTNKSKGTGTCPPPEIKYSKVCNEQIDWSLYRYRH